MAFSARMTRAIIIGVSTLAVAACGGGTDSADKPKDGPLVTADEADATVDIGDGKVNIDAQASQNTALPLGLPKMAGAKVAQAVTANSKLAGNANAVRMETSGSAADVAAFYKDAFAKADIKKETEVNFGGALVLMGKAASGERVMINAKSGKDGKPTEVIVAVMKGGMGGS